MASDAKSRTIRLNGGRFLINDRTKRFLRHLFVSPRHFLAASSRNCSPSDFIRIWFVSRRQTDRIGRCRLDEKGQKSKSTVDQINETFDECTFENFCYPFLIRNSIWRFSGLFQFNYWLQNCILECGNVDERIAVMNRILEIMTVFDELNNFNGLIEIHGVMQSSPIFRLNHTIEVNQENLPKIFFPWQFVCRFRNWIKIYGKNITKYKIYWTIEDIGKFNLN